jgi:predicted lipid-binding transport protein (Tim44 family)
MKCVLLCALLIAWSGMASAVVYKWVDSHGKLQYGDRPPDGVHAEIVEMPGSHTAPSAPQRPTAAAPPTATAPQTAPPAQDGAKQAVDNDVAQTREKQCADAQERYKKLIEGRKLYKAGPDGERQYLSSEEIDAERLSAKHDVDTICNSQS